MGRSSNSCLETRHATASILFNTAITTILPQLQWRRLQSESTRVRRGLSCKPRGATNVHRWDLAPMPGVVSTFTNKEKKPNAANNAQQEECETQNQKVTRRRLRTQKVEGRWQEAERRRNTIVREKQKVPSNTQRILDRRRNVTSRTQNVNGETGCPCT